MNPVVGYGKRGKVRPPSRCALPGAPKKEPRTCQGSLGHPLNPLTAISLTHAANRMVSTTYRICPLFLCPQLAPAALHGRRCNEPIDNSARCLPTFGGLRFHRGPDGILFPAVTINALVIMDCHGFADDCEGSATTPHGQGTAAPRGAVEVPARRTSRRCPAG